MNAPSQGIRDRANARVGQVLRGKWRLDELIAVGGMASVYAATHRNGKRGAVKLLHYELSLNDESRTRFLREGYVANKVDHEGAVSVLDDDVCEDGTVFLVMELLEGQTVDDLLRARNAKTIGLGETLRVADRLLDVLAAAHDKGVVHRDVKPENLFITKKGALKVLDFGIARLREVTANAGHTRAGDLLGTPNFMPPEQALGNTEQVDPRSDLWSVAATVFRLLTGRPVHHAESINRVLLAAMTMPAPPLRRVLPTVPAQLASIVDRALSFEQRDRWPDARLMREALRAFAQEAGIRLDGHVLEDPDEARLRPVVRPVDHVPHAARPLPAAGRPVYTPSPESVPIGDPEPHRSPVAPPSFSGAPPPTFGPAPPYAPPPAPDAMSLAGLMPDADDCDDDAATKLREPTYQGHAVPNLSGAHPGFGDGADISDDRPTAALPPPPSVSGPRPAAGAPPENPLPGQPAGLQAAPGPASAAPTFGAAADQRPPSAFPSTPTFGNTAGEPPVTHTPSFNTAERPITLAPSLTPSFHMGERPVTLAPSLTPSFNTAASVSQTFGYKPRSTRLAPFVVLGAVVVLGGLLALVLFRGGSPSAADSRPEAPVSSGVPAPPPSAEPPPATAAPSEPAATSTPPPATAASSAPAPAPAAPSASAPAASSAPAAKPTAPKPPPTTAKPRPSGGSSKGDPFSSRKW